MITAQVMAGAPAGGAELFFERLCRALTDAGDSVLPVIRRNVPRAAQLRGAGMEPAELRFGGPLDVVTRRRLRRLLQEAAPAVVMAWMGRAAAVAPTGGWTLVGRLGGYYDLRRFRHCRHLVGNTAHIVEWIRQSGVPADRVHYLPNFVPDLLGAAPAERSALGVPDDAFMLLALGRLHRSKGFETLIDALPGLPGVHVVIAGEGPERAALTGLAAARGVADRAHLPGWREDVPALLAASDLFVCPSRSEPLGNIVLEAWSAARPVVAAASVGPAALIRDGRDGVLVPPEQPGALRDAIATLLGAPDRRAALAGCGRERFVAGFAEAGVVAQWRGFFHEVAR